MACALRAWATSRREKNLVRNLRYGAQTWYVSGLENWMYMLRKLRNSQSLAKQEVWVEECISPGS